MRTINRLSVPLTKAEIQPIFGAQSVYKEAGLSVPDQDLPQRVSEIVKPYLHGEQAIYLQDMNELRDVTTFLTMATEISEDDYYQRVAEQILYANQLDYRISRFGDPSTFSLTRKDVTSETEVDIPEPADEHADPFYLEDLGLTGNVESADTVQYVAEVIGWLKENTATLKSTLQERIEAAQEKYRKGQDLDDEIATRMVDATPEVSGTMAAEMIEGVRDRGYQSQELGNLLKFIRDNVHLMTRDANSQFVEFLRDESVREASLNAANDVERDELPTTEGDPVPVDSVLDRIFEDRLLDAKMMDVRRSIAFDLLGADYYLHQSLDLLGSWAEGSEEALADMLSHERWRSFAHVERGFVRRYMNDRGSLLARFHTGGKLLEQVIGTRDHIRSRDYKVESSYLSFIGKLQSVLPPAGDIVAHGAYRLFLCNTIEEALERVESGDAIAQLETMRTENEEGLKRLKFEAQIRAGIEFDDGSLHDDAERDSFAPCMIPTLLPF